MKIENIEDCTAGPDDEETVVCIRVTEKPIPEVPATIVNCVDCGARIWLADSSPRGIKCKCFECVEKQMATEKEGNVLVLNAEQRKKLARGDPKTIETIARLQRAEEQNEGHGEEPLLK